jgi:DNA-binding transcriptional regulator GbsR (MarR family)
MGRQRHTAEQIIGKLWEAEVLQGKEMATQEILGQLGVSDASMTNGGRSMEDCGSIRQSR